MYISCDQSYKMFRLALKYNYNMIRLENETITQFLVREVKLSFNSYNKSFNILTEMGIYFHDLKEIKD